MYNNYDDIKSFLPIFYNEVFEMQAILQTAGHALDKLEEGEIRVLLNNFIMDADKESITKLETFLQIKNESRSLDERRRLVASYFVGFGKINATKIKEIVYSFTSANSEVYFEDSTVSIEIERGISESLYLIDVNNIISSRIPAHLPFVLVIKFTINVEVTTSVKRYKFEYPLTNTLFCGTHPGIATLGKLESANIETSNNIESFTFEFILCGTHITGA